MGALNVARACAEVDAHLLHISTDYVFSGDKGQYQEGDAPNPRNVYGMSKLAGENLVTQAGGRVAVVRVSSVYGSAGNGGRGGNFIETILKRGRETGKLQVVDDVFMSPTYTVDAAKALNVLLEQGFTGLTHLSSFARINWYTFAKQAVELTKVKAEVTPVPATTYPSKATRPTDSSLATTQLPKDARAAMSPWQDALCAYLSAQGYSAKATLHKAILQKATLQKASARKDTHVPHRLPYPTGDRWRRVYRLGAGALSA